MDPSLVRRAIRKSRVGKKMPKAIYIHKSCVREPLISKFLVSLVKGAQEQAHREGKAHLVGVTSWDVVKIAQVGSTVSFLTYPGFKEIRNPILTRSVCVNLDKQRITVWDYGSNRNPPILHRKELLVDATQPMYFQFRSETEEDEALGLFNYPGIGNLHGWIRAQREIGNV